MQHKTRYCRFLPRSCPQKPYARLYIGKIGPELAQRIYKDTGVNTENLNVAITSEFEDSHSNPEKERSRGQTPVTPEILSRLPEIISSYDKVENTTSSKDRKPVLKFEKDINGKNVAVEYVRSKKGMLELHTMYAWENKNSRSVSTTLTMPEKLTRTERPKRIASLLLLLRTIYNQVQKKQDSFPAGWCRRYYEWT